MSTAQHSLAVDVARAADPWSAAPFDAATAQALQRALQPLDARQRLWLSGYLAGSCAAAAVQPVATTAAKPAVAVLYGSQSGNCERLAKELGELLASTGVSHIVVDMLDCQKRHLQEAQVLLVIVSTHGEGEPPDRAMAFHELLHSRKAPSLSHLKYAVLALGDSSYEKFCETGKQFDARLSALGAKPILARTDCDVDFEAPAKQWMDSVLERLRKELDVDPAPTVAVAERSAAAIATAYTRRNPFHAPVLVNQRLTARTSAKDVRHIELSLEGSGIHYEPGDAIGVVPRNDAVYVDALLQQLPYEADAPVTIEGNSISLRQALIERVDLGPFTASWLNKYAAHAGEPRLSEFLAAADADAMHRFLDARDILDLIVDHPPRALDAQGFVQLLRPLAPRLYSIASSQRATPDEVHLTIGLVSCEARGRVRFGVASKQLADAHEEGATAPIYLHRNPNFRLPADPDAPVIMIGPGTGVAPFRGFIAERDALGARGRNWLFFGERHFITDFLYHTEWLDYRKRGILHRIDVAFSRDQAHKIYVQHRLLERGRDVYAWIQDGAHIYVCGDAKRMAADVQQALLEILRRHGGRTSEQAAEDLLELQRARRYQRDVY